ncbi:ABC transporter ATP-binding protein [Bradyrhizobium sp. AUGA SZCCT0240]|jgi:ABC-type nitrate/sulfonate/bicarbonate transport system ATPase subunit|uniref:ABC transporter ATP-binding protein n=1 Tax=unclassified Bradyrhizobium TaxID=2631580 RepID=UPI001BA8A336|nr:MULTISPECIES: ABC transporter ATP-binding protein [unclassified Bradyrhizobium]MBR1191768.1 ABC transporter ATP-binding protein [Bradyrhizobium sp. AUGA SZCCT0160]MBR1197122.1 ABC transporter ATP-binding protein [Bradyrhizobium sp. AUGA SZCCT0158]MBR1240074.1 ABC transporter ATP-binding protein [Bradyrhizobium sp. AUGA SZCCT0274]MBR1248111.1 ABC transporter ATP-binding protein [Bradyrhizobium sp. AUGA SZCCT0169]MBR1254032.1 ABC transporter ATP-binding protein [Bradyrhizobium sp. AUGA SZCCT0
MNTGARVLSIVPDKTVGLAADETGASAAVKPMLKFERVGFEYDRRSIMSNVSFAIRPGELVALLGPSGCGKTTILNLVAGFLQPTEGVAFIDNREIAGPGPDRGVVFQAAALFNWMTVADNISFSLRCAGRPKAERQQVAEEMAALVGLSGFENSYPYQLSGGMRQRVGLARVLAAKPKVMLMDEPFSALDVQTREVLQEEVLRIRERTGCTILFVTHSIDEAVFLGDRIFLLTDLKDGSFDEFAVDLPSPRDTGENRLHPSFIRLREMIYRKMRH